MDRESVERLRFDRRLSRRRGWVDEAEAAQALDALPDVSEKMTTAAELEAEEAAAAEEASAEEAPAETPAPVAGDFGAPTNLGGGGFSGSSGGGSPFS